MLFLLGQIGNLLSRGAKRGRRLSAQRRRLAKARLAPALEALEPRSMLAAVAGEDFDGGDLNLISGFDPSTDNLDGGGGDFIGVGNVDAWPQSGGVPFSLSDDTVVAIGEASPNATDDEGVFGQARLGSQDDFFGLSDTREWSEAERTVSWSFNIADFENLQLSIDMGGISDADFGGFSDTTNVRFTVQIDSNPVQTAFDVNAIDPTGFATRPMDSGLASGGGRLLEVTGDNAVTKLLAEDGSAAANTYLDKTPASGAGAGQLDTFTTAITGTGSVLTLTMVADLPFEAMAFDNIAITGDATGVDSPPAITTLSPTDDGTDVPVDANLVITFNENVAVGTGNLTVTNGSSQVIDVTGSEVSVARNVVTVDLPADLDPSTAYSVQIDPGAFEDLAGNDFAGIADTTTWNFQTAAPADPPDTTPPAYDEDGPFTVSVNASAGTVVGDIDANDGDGADTGVTYSILSAVGASMAAGQPGWTVDPILTIGETLFAGETNEYTPPGVLDGLGAYELDANTVRVLANHELLQNRGYDYTVGDGAGGSFALDGSRISYFDIDKTTRQIVDAGLAYNTIYDALGEIATDPSFLANGFVGFSRFCSAGLFEAHQFGEGRGLEDRIYFAGEEDGGGFNPVGGAEWALDVATGNLWHVPAMGRGAWENITEIDTGTTTHVAFILSDDTSPFDVDGDGAAEAAPLYLYVGEKDASGDFLERNGLRGGKLYVWVADNGDTLPSEFNGFGQSRDGHWVEIENAPVVQGTPFATENGQFGFDEYGYPTQRLLWSQAEDVGAFGFSRPEDVATNPANGAEFVLASTGVDTYDGGVDTFGTMYKFQVDFSGINAPTGHVTIIYDGDEDPTRALRSPDNLDWADDGKIYVQEDKAEDFGPGGEPLFGDGAANPNEAGIVQLDPITGVIRRVANVNRSVVLDGSIGTPGNAVDTDAGAAGEWETSGILDVSTLFGETEGTLFLFDVQAHGIVGQTGFNAGSRIDNDDLVEGGQLSFLQKTPSAFRINPNTGVITVGDATVLAGIGVGEQVVTVVATDAAGNAAHTDVSINVTNDEVEAAETVRFATFNTSLNRNAEGELIADLSTPDNGQARSIAAIIQESNPDVVLLNEFDFDASGIAADLFRQNYLEVPQDLPGGGTTDPVYYPYVYFAPSNTGLPSGFDLDNSGTIGGGNDAFGFGTYPGQYGMVIFSKYEILTDQVRTFQQFLWNDMPDNLIPDGFYSPEELEVLRLSSKSHWDVPINVNGKVIHVLAAHPTPPVFDGPEDRNGTRNHDEIRFWADYVDPTKSGYIYDDAGGTGGLAHGEPFVVLGDYNADPFDGDSTNDAALQFTANPLFNNSVIPASAGGPADSLADGGINASHVGDPANDTSDFADGAPGNLRVDYALPSADLEIVNSFVFWPGPTDPNTALVGNDTTSQPTDHRLVAVDINLVEPPPKEPLGTKELTVTQIGNYATGVFDEGATEIVAFDPTSDRLFSTNGDTGSVDVLDVSDPTNPTLITSIVIGSDSTLGGDSANSVAVSNGILAVAVKNATATDPGSVLFYDTATLAVLNEVQVGSLPDMLIFTPDGMKVLVANEAEPDDLEDPNPTIDPMGSVSIIDLSRGVAAATVTTLDFTEFDGQVEQLRSEGVRIFPGRLPSRDFEPEYIAISPDGNTAFVALQEANAFAALDIVAAAWIDIIPLGLKDHSRGLPSLTTYDIDVSGIVIGQNSGGVDVELGGFSGLEFLGITTEGLYEFATVPDKGPDGGNSLESRIVKFTLDPTTGETAIVEQIALTEADGVTPLNGLPNDPDLDPADVDLDPGDGVEPGFNPFGADLESLSWVPDGEGGGSWFAVDEWRPAIYRFSADGVLQNRFVPAGTAAAAGENPGTFGNETLPAAYGNRRNNRGFEGGDYNPDDGLFYAFIQTPLANPDGTTSNTSHVIRMVGIDPATGFVMKELVYLLERPAANNVDKIGDVDYAGDGKFLVIERDSGTDPTSQKFVFEVDTRAATNVLGMTFGGQTLEQLINADGLAAEGIRAVDKVKVTNLPSLGYLPSDKPEGIVQLPDGRIAVLNDNDFEPGTKATQLGIIDFTGGNGLDASDRDDAINIQNWPVYGMFNPDAITSFESNGATYYISANEGDTRDFDESRVKDLVLDPEAFPNAAELQEDENLGRLTVSNIDGDIDGDGDYDRLQAFGGRSFTIWDANGNLVFDSGDDFEQTIAHLVEVGKLPQAAFNSSNDDNDDFDSRSDAKGPEPEAVTVGEIDGRMYAFIGLERVGGIMIYNVDDPTSPVFVDYITNRNFDVDADDPAAGDLGPEDLKFISAVDSPNGVPLLVSANEVSGTITIYELGRKNFTLELLHVADQEGSTAQLSDITGLSAVLNALRAQEVGNDHAVDNTLVLSSGDAFIPGLFYNASEVVFGAGGIADILIQNELGFQAIALGNHEFDFGTEELAGLIDGSADGDGGFLGTAFPYLSANLDFSTDANLAGLEVDGGEAPEARTVTSSVVIDVNGESIGVVGATTPTLGAISSPGDVGITPIPFGGNPTPAELDALAAIIQAEVDQLLANNPLMNKVILLAHMQQITIEYDLAARLENVDIIVAGGSNTRLFDDDDSIRPGDSDQGQYPQFIVNAGGTMTAVVNTDGSYKYVGRLVIEFDPAGNIIPESYDETVSGAYRTDAEGVLALDAKYLVDPEVMEIVELIEAQIIATEGNVFGISDVFLNGNRSGIDTPDDPDGVRTQETNLGNLTADANLAEAKKVDSTVVVSIKNGGGIRASIGETVVPPGGTEAVRLPNSAVFDGGGNLIKPEGGISQNDIATSLAFNNGLSLLTLTKAELVAALEHGVGAIPGVSGRFPQVSGVKFSFDPTAAEGSRIRNAGIFDEADNLVAELVCDGAIVGDPSETFRIVTLNFLAGGGDGYPFPTGTGANRVDLYDLDGNGDDEATTGAATFAFDGTEQDALAEYLAANFATDATAYNEGDVGRDMDERIQNLAFRDDTVLGDPPVGGVTAEVVDGTLVVNGTEEADDIEIVSSGGTLTVLSNGVAVGSPFDIAAEGIEAISVFARGGDDDVVVDPDINLWTLLSGGAGRDFLIGGGGQNILLGGAGNDVLEGGAGNDILIGGAGNDALLGRAGRDILLGGAGDDLLVGGLGADLLFGGAGSDIEHQGTLQSLLDTLTLEETEELLTTYF